MKRRYKLLIIILVGVMFAVIINSVNPKNKITLVAIGDSLSSAQTPYGIVGKSFTDYLSDFLDKNNKLLKYNYDYSYDHLNINELNEYLENNTFKNGISIKQLISKSDILTIAIGIDEFADISLRKEIAIDDINNFIHKYEMILHNIRSFYKKKVIVIGLYQVNNIKQSNVIELNKKLSVLCGKYDAIFIDVLPYTINKEYYFSNSNYYLNYRIHKKIFEIIVNSNIIYDIIISRE